MSVKSVVGPNYHLWACEQTLVYRLELPIRSYKREAGSKGTELRLWATSYGPHMLGQFWSETKGSPLKKLLVTSGESWNVLGPKPTADQTAWNAGAVTRTFKNCPSWSILCNLGAECQTGCPRRPNLKSSTSAPGLGGFSRDILLALALVVVVDEFNEIVVVAITIIIVIMVIAIVLLIIL